MNVALAQVKQVVYEIGMDKKEIRVQLVISAPELRELDQWRAKHEIWSRSAAIRQLIAEGVKRGR